MSQTKFSFFRRTAAQMRLAAHLLRKSFGSVLLFEAGFKLVGAAAFGPLFYLLFHFALWLAKMPYLSSANLVHFLLRPTTVCLLILVFFLICLYALFDICAVLFCYHEIWSGNSVGPIDMVKFAAVQSRRLLQRKNLILPLFMLIIVPFANLVLILGSVLSFKLPTYLLSLIRPYRLQIAIVCGIIAFLFMLSVRWLYSLHIFILEQALFSDAAKKSAKFVRGHFWQDLFAHLLWNLIALAIYAAVVALCVTILVVVTRLLSNVYLAYAVAGSSLMILLAIAAGMCLLFDVPDTFAFVSALYYSRKQALDEPIPQTNCEIPLPRVAKRYGKIFIALLTAFSLALNGSYLYLGVTNKIDFGTDLIRYYTICAHRGFSSEYPENTMPAFQAAVDLGADCLELDVRQASDGTLVISHDATLKRTAGVSIGVSSSTYAELTQYDVGSSFSSAFSGITIPTLEDVLRLARGRTRLNIELKPSVFDADLEQRVIALVRQYGMQNFCVLSCMNYDTLKRIKELDSNIKTAYIATIAYGNYASLEAADALSLQATFLTSSAVSKAHSAGKAVYAWTVNTPAAINEMMELNVDEIITDLPTLAIELRTDYTQRDWVTTMIQGILAIF
ncbi:MAG: glycerophosphodiester phosphodiesterase family protein [Oscillospiraceae bacterium]|nr:glycerophosphodiester phosphodiesterase family protein [Oscillospiraceae bacterium]